MESFTKHQGIVAALDRVNVDTDQIIPKQFLKRIERSGFGKFLFFDWRFTEEGEPNPDFELNQEKYSEASILLTGANFGCGSSREHAPWALLDYGFKVIIAPSFADIFFNNCFKNGMLPIRLSSEEIRRLFQIESESNPYQLAVDLEEQVLSDSEGRNWPFEIDPFRKEALLQGLDDIGLTLQHESSIQEYESRRRSFL